MDTALQRHRPRERDRPGADRQLAAFGLREDTYACLRVAQGTTGKRGVIPLGAMAGRQRRRGDPERDRRRHERDQHGGPH